MLAQKAKTIAVVTAYLIGPALRKRKIPEIIVLQRGLWLMKWSPTCRCIADGLSVECPVKHLWIAVAALGLLMPAGFANASAVTDPTVIINKTDPSCSSSGVICFHSIFGVGAVELDLVNGLLPSEDLEYAGDRFNPHDSLTTLFVILDGVLPNEKYTCSSNVFSDCSLVFPWDISGFTWGKDWRKFDVFEFTDPTSTISSGAGFEASVTTPEPGTLLLLLSGLVPVIGFGRKRWGSGGAA
jgi:hypothetical protein